ncbi:MAG: paraquat-inducible protein B, partial [Deltaproteobacteria bacterium]
AFVAKDETQKAPEAVVGLVDDLRKFVASDDVQNTPKALRGTLDEAQALLAELNKSDAAARIVTAIDNVSTAATAVTDAATGLPALVATLTELSNTAKGLPLGDLADSAKKTVDDIGKFIGSDDMAALPKTLSETLEQAKLMLSELREGGSVTNLNEALASAKSAAAAVEKAGADLPALVERLNGTVSKINELAAGYGQNSPFGRDVNDTLRELSGAAKSVAALARAIERNPQAFIFGK